MTDIDNLSDFRGLEPFFRIIEEGLSGLADGDHFFDLHADDERLSELLKFTIDAPLVFRAFQKFDRAKSRRSNEFHQHIRDAIANGDAARASRLMIEHIDQGRDALLLE